VLDEGGEILAAGDVDDADARLPAVRHDLLCNSRELLLAARGEHNLVTPRGEQPPDGGADATARTRDRDDLTDGLHDQKMTEPRTPAFVAGTRGHHALAWRRIHARRQLGGRAAEKKAQRSRSQR
jgi:hypothetical protein